MISNRKGRRSAACRIQEQVAAVPAVTAPEVPAPGPSCSGRSGDLEHRGLFPEVGRHVHGPSCSARSAPAPDSEVPPPDSGPRSRWRKPLESSPAPAGQASDWQDLLLEEVWRVGRPLPAYVKNCAKNPDRTEELWGYVWHPDACQDLTRFPYCCRSWRCDWGCAEHERHVLYTRVTDALVHTDTRDLVMFVLTYDGQFHDLTRTPSGTDARGWCHFEDRCEKVDDDSDRRRMLNLEELFRSLGQRKEWLFKRLNRFLESTCTRCGLAPESCFACDGRLKKSRDADGNVVAIVCRRKKCGRVQGCEGGCRYIGGLTSEWYGVVESHESGVPHLNLVLHHPRWAWWLNERLRARIDAGAHGKRARYLAHVREKRDAIDDVLAEMLGACGFGFASTCEQVRNKEQLINYTIKLAAAVDEVSVRMATQIAKRKADAQSPVRRKRQTRKQYRADELAAAELTKNSQRPVLAPKGMRRTRTGRNFLEPRHKGPNTGLVVKRTTNSQGDVRVVPLQKPTREDLAMMQQLIIECEQRLAYDEKRSKGRLDIQRQAMSEKDWSTSLDMLNELGALRSIASNELGTLNVRSAGLHAQLDEPSRNRAELFAQLDAVGKARKRVREELRQLDVKGKELCDLLGVRQKKKHSPYQVSKHTLELSVLHRLGLTRDSQRDRLLDSLRRRAGIDAAPPVASAIPSPPGPMSVDDRIWAALESDDPLVVAALVESLRAEVLAPRSDGPVSSDDEWEQREAPPGGSSWASVCATLEQA